MTSANTTKKKRTPAKRKPRRTYDWMQIRQTFIMGTPKDPAKPDGDRTWMNLRELSDHLDVPYERVRERSSAERWYDERTKYQADLAKRRMKARVEKLGSEAIEFDDQTLSIAKLGVKLVATRMTEIAREVGEKQKIKELALAKMEAGLPVEKHELLSAVYHRELEGLAKSASLFQEIGMRSLGTDIQRHEVNGKIDTDQTVTVEHHISVARELERDDPDRLGAFLAAAHQAGVFQQLAELESTESGEDQPPTEEEVAAQDRQDQEQDEIFDAEIVD